MTETRHQTKSAEPTPEQLMQLLDLQIASQRSRRKGGGKHRATLLAGGLLFILAATFAALFVLQQMAGDLQRPTEPVAAEASEIFSQ